MLRNLHERIKAGNRILRVNCSHSLPSDHSRLKYVCVI